MLEHLEEQLNGLKLELSDILHGILALDIDSTELNDEEARISEGISEARLHIRRLISSSSPTTTHTVAQKEGAIRLPKIEVPKFDGNIMHWRRFWEQFKVSIDSKSQLDDAEKLTYLEQALKDGPAKNAIEGLSGSGDDYQEAIECLRKRYDRPRLLHQAHVRAIVEAPSLKDGGGKELRRLHDTLNQHLRSLKNMHQESYEAFVTSLIELKLDQTTTFEWQKYSQDDLDVPKFERLLEFLDLRAQASESLSQEIPKRQTQTQSRKI